jgi:hypothetical protein
MIVLMLLFATKGSILRADAACFQLGNGEWGDIDLITGEVGFIDHRTKDVQTAIFHRSILPCHKLKKLHHTIQRMHEYIPLPSLAAQATGIQGGEMAFVFSTSNS